MEQSKKPSDSAFKQQRMKAWQPLLTPKVVLPTFFLIAVVFIPIGVAILLASNSVTEIVMDYTNCDAASPDFTQVEGQTYEWKYETIGSEKLCSLRFAVPDDIAGPVFLYYRLTNFFQNHRRYVKSFSAEQLRGKAYIPEFLSECEPLVHADEPESGPPLIAIYPCGLIANSMFNDTFSNLTRTTDNEIFAFSEKGIAWPGDQKRYGTPEYNLDENGNPLPPGTPLRAAPPPNWSSYNGTYTSENLPDLSKDEHFQVWMRTAGLPNFRKLYGKTDETLTSGIYIISIVDRYPVEEFGGTKSVVISNTSWIGGKNSFLGIAYLTVGSICIFLGVAFSIRHLIAPRALGDHSYIKWK